MVASRLGAALSLGAVGVGVSGLFVVQGAPDLVLTQLLVETIIVVGFVLGLRQLGRTFPAIDRSWRAIRVVVAAFVGSVVVLGLAAATSAPTGQAPVARLQSDAVAKGGGNNVVNVILTDMRALDTLGEVLVLVTVALGIVALAAAPRTVRQR